MIRRRAKAIGLRIRALVTERESAARGEGGWALLGLLLALGVMSIVMASAIVPNVKVQVQRDKETEMLYRGDQMARGIARYYNGGNLANFQVSNPPPYGYLTELMKLRDGVKRGVNDLKFVRASALIDPMISLEWEPVRLRDPRIMKNLQAFAGETQIPIPPPYLLMAAPPQALEEEEPTDPSGSGDPQPPGATPKTNPPPRGTSPSGNPNDPAGNGEINDPLKHLFDDSDSSKLPIVGVAPRVKGKALRPLYGLDRYEDWVFIYQQDTRNLGVRN